MAAALAFIAGCELNEGQGAGGGTAGGGSAGGGSAGGGSSGGGSSGGGSAGGGSSGGGSAGGGSSGGGSSGGGSSGGGSAGGGSGLPDAGFFGTPRCAAANVRLCESFEAPSLDGTTWSRQEVGAGSVAIDTTRAARGTRSLHVHTTASAGSTAFIRTTRIFPMPNNTLYGRAFVFMLPPSSQPHTTLFQAWGKLPSGQQAYYRLGDPAHILGANYDTPGSTPRTDYAQRSTTPMPTGRWACLEWAFKGNTNALEFWLDEVPITGANIASTHVPQWTAPAFERLDIGFKLYAQDDPGATAFDLWFDEIAVDVARIGCRR